MSAPVVRRATDDDLPRVAAVRNAAWRVAYRGIVADEDLAALDDAHETARWREFAKEFEANGSTLLVVTLDEAVAGYALVRSRARDESVPDDVGELIALYVGPPAWGTGAGQALVDAATTALRDAGCAAAVLWTFEANGRARRFYERNGWTPDGERDRYRGEPELRYRRELTSCRAG